jgi:hypothetical protein
MTEEYFNQVIDRANLIRNTPEIKALIEPLVLSTIKHSSKKQSQITHSQPEKSIKNLRSSLLDPPKY